MNDENVSYVPGIGLDVGTSFIQLARETTDGRTVFVAERDAFFAIKPSSPIAAKFIEKSLTQRNAFVLKADGIFYVVGKEAISAAIERGGIVERPLKKGVLTGQNTQSMQMLATLIKSLVKEAKVPNEVCVYTYPATPFDESFDIIYHQRRMSEILGKLGYTAIPLLEAQALSYSELMDDDLTGISISCGAGMFNLAVFLRGECILSFSLAIGGDYIDQAVAKPMGISETEVQSEKESPEFDLNNPKGEVQETIVMYYDNLIKYVTEVFEKKFAIDKDVPRFTKPIPVVIAGGTSMPKGFLERMDVALRSKSFPFQIGEIRQAKNPLTAVAAGCLIYSQMVGSE